MQSGRTEPADQGHSMTCDASSPPGVTPNVRSSAAAISCTRFSLPAISPVHNSPSRANSSAVARHAPAPDLESGTPSARAGDVNNGTVLVAYFSMELALENHLPTYSGGLGVLGADTLRSAADLRLPMIGVSLVHRRGYFYQRLTAAGAQVEEPVHWSPDDWPHGR
jgi:hypothetical protein